MSKLIEVTGADLKRIREEKGLTAKQLADKMGLAINLVFKWESGRGNMSLRKIERICEALGVDPRMHFK